jgi:hypothetical protein
MMMLVMRVRHVRVPVQEPAMPVRMRMRLARRVTRAVRVLVMRVMHMRVGVREHLVLVLMLVVFGEMQPHPKGHEGAGNK